MRIFFKLLLAATLALLVWFVWAALLPVPPAGTKFVLLHPGWTTRHIARELQSKGIIRSTTAFLMLHYAGGMPALKAGEYKFDQPANVLEVRRRLMKGDVYARTV